ncbi:hypothetical protein ACQ4PT_039073 [Festuca glaucescens]
MDDGSTVPRRWRVTYHSLISQRAASRQVHGLLYLRPQALRLVLLDADGVTVDARFLKKDEVISQGSEVDMPCHSVKVGLQELPASPQDQEVHLIAKETMDIPNELANDHTVVDLNCHPQPHDLDPTLSLTVGLPRPDPRLVTPVVNPRESLFTSRSLYVTPSPPYSPAPGNCSSSPSPPPPTTTLLQSEMANFPVDPSPFIPGQFELIEVANRPQQCRYHVSTTVSAKNEDVAIATINPTFPGELPFTATQMFLRSFLEDELGFSMDMSQRCPIGSTYIRVSSPSDRDWLVNHSPHQLQGREVSFVEHNRGINCHAFTYNRECWIMLLAFPSDLWTDEHIRGAVKDFGALISWDKEVSTYGALIAKVRVVDLHFIPHSCVVSSGNEWSAESWSIPIFILSQRLLGGLPADEELPPADGSTPHPMPNAPFQGNHAASRMHAPMNNAANGWPFWQHMNHVDGAPRPNDPVNLAGQNVQHFLGHNGGLDLNDLPPHEMDLNHMPHQLVEADFIELNDLLHPVPPHNEMLPVVFALPAPLQNQPEDVDMLPNEDNQSDITVTVSSDHTLSDGSGGSVNGAPHHAQHQQLHIGMALTPNYPMDPVIAVANYNLHSSSIIAASDTERETFIFSKEGTSAWSTHFKPDGSIINTVNVPAQWADFFTAKLLTPEDFEWRKSLLQ